MELFLRVGLFCEMGSVQLVKVHDAFLGYLLK